jgi:hypothetical protein
MIEDIIFDHYKSKQNKRPFYDFSQIKEAKELNLVTLNIGLGDAIALTCLTQQSSKKINIFSPNKHWQTLCKFNSALNPVGESKNYIRTELIELCDVGNGHLSQRLQRTLGLPVQRLPKPYLYPTLPFNKKRNKVALHFSTGVSAFDLIQHGFVNPRQLEDWAQKEILKFIDDSNFEFVEFGMEQKFQHSKVKDFTKKSVEDSINEMATCEYFMGLNSGFMNIAAALDLKSIIVVNVPDVKDLYLPVIQECSTEDMNWLYPQNVHLHQNGENELVKKLSVFNIKKAFNGEIYPFWSHKFLDLIF